MPHFSVAVFCSVLQSVAVCCSVLLCVVYGHTCDACNTQHLWHMQHTALVTQATHSTCDAGYLDMFSWYFVLVCLSCWFVTAYKVCSLQCVAVCCNVLQCVAVCCSILLLCCSVLQCTAHGRTHCIKDPLVAGLFPPKKPTISGVCTSAKEPYIFAKEADTCIFANELNEYLQNLRQNRPIPLHTHNPVSRWHAATHCNTLQHTATHSLHE